MGDRGGNPDRVAFPNFLTGQRRQGGAPADALSFRFLGPVVGNRIASVAGVPGNPYIYYAGAASGGIWKTTDGGIRWTPISDSLPVAAIGALAVAPSDPNVVWAGTGEAWAIRDSDVIGDGMYKSTDAGKTWTHAGLDETGRIARILIHPTNPDIVFACATGRLTAPQQERGVFRTTNGGQKWERVLFVDENTGCSGLSMDAKNPRNIFAGTWQVEIIRGRRSAEGPGSGVFVSPDGGTTWRGWICEERSRKLGPAIRRSVWQDRRRRGADRLESRLRADSDEGPGIGLAVRRRRRQLAGRQLAASADRTGGLLHSPPGIAGERRRSVRVEQLVLAIHRWRPLVRRAVLGRRQPRHLVGSQGCRSLRHHTRRRPDNHDEHARSTQRVTLPIGQKYHVTVDNQIRIRLLEHVRTPIVENIPGAAGTIGLARFIGAERGNGDALLVSGLIMLGGIVTHDSPVTLARRRRRSRG